MPTYDYECRKCGHRFELFHSMSDDAMKRCPKCRSKAHRVPSAGAGLLFKGSGFYITDYRSKSYKEQAKQERAVESKGGADSAGDTKSAKGGSDGAAAAPAAKDSAGTSSGTKADAGSSGGASAAGAASGRPGRGASKSASKASARPSSASGKRGRRSGGA